MSVNQPVDIDKIRDKNGRMIAPLPGAAPRITSDNARDMVARRVAKYRQAAIKRIVGEASSIDPSVSTGADAFGLLAARQYSALIDSDKPAVDHLERLYKIMTGSGDNSQRAHEPVAGTISLDAQSLLDLADLLARQREHVTAQARAVDAE
jgi:hypothetical protein